MIYQEATYLPTGVKVKLTGFRHNPFPCVLGHRSHLVHGQDIEHGRGLAGRLEQHVSHRVGKDILKKNVFCLFI